MKIKFCSWFPLGKFSAINLCGYLIVKDRYKKSFQVPEGQLPRQSIIKLINHEADHSEQMREMLYIFFYLWYGIEWLIRVLTPPMKTAYKDISFEQEAYIHEYDFTYLDYRKRYHWLTRIFKSFRKGNCKLAKQTTVIGTKLSKILQSIEVS